MVNQCSLVLNLFSTMQKSKFTLKQEQAYKVLTADWAVTWVHPTIFAPSKGLSLAFLFLSKIKPGISVERQTPVSGKKTSIT